jgi:hypothetical protein
MPLDWIRRHNPSKDPLDRKRRSLSAHSFLLLCLAPRQLLVMSAPRGCQ